MNENIDLTKILKDCPKGTKLYSPLFGYVELKEIDTSKVYYVNVKLTSGLIESFTREGKLYDRDYYKDAECVLFPSKDQRDWSKFTAPWLKKESDTINCIKKKGEQEEPQVYETEDGEIITYSETDGYKFVEPKFHKGQWIACKGLNTALIINIVNNKYEVEFLDGNKGFPNIDYVDRLFHLWTIKDAKDGNVLVDKYNNIGIFQECEGICWHSYIYLGCDDKLRGFSIGSSHEQTDTHPATKEQHDAMMKAMNDAGYKWNAKTKTLEELIKPKFDPNTLQPFDKVIARNFNDQIWHADIFSHVETDEDGSYYNVIKNDNYLMVIPYNDDTIYLVGTSLEAPEFYRYWEN